MTPEPPILRVTDVIDRLIPAVESAAQTFFIMKMFVDLAQGRAATFSTLLEGEDITAFELELAGIIETQRHCLLSCARITQLLRKLSNVFPPPDKFPLVKAAVNPQPLPKDLKLP